jgi:AcrR family transcriptional regulator
MDDRVVWLAEPHRGFIPDESGTIRSSYAVRMPTGGRKAQAARNDTAILDAARAVFVADPGAPIAAVAARAGVGISALYRRYPSKEDLLRKVCGDALRTYVGIVEDALADKGDEWKVFKAFMHRAVEADTHALISALDGALEGSSEPLWREATKAQDLTERLFKRSQKAGAVRGDAVVEDLANVFQQLTAIRGDSERRTAELRKRYLTLQLDGLRPRKKAQRLPGPPPRFRPSRGG